MNASGEKGWIEEVEIISSATFGEELISTGISTTKLVLVLLIEQHIKGIVNFDKEVLEGNYDTTFPYFTIFNKCGRHNWV